MTSVRDTFGNTFRSLKIRNYRLFYVGQFVSLSGTWMQLVAQSWLVLKLTGSGTAVGGVMAAQFLPMLLAGPFGGVVADRVDKRRALIALQAMAGALAALLGLLAATGLARVWVVYLLALLFGCVSAVEVPTRQSFILEMVGMDRVTNAVSLNSVLMNATRVTGPAVAGALIAFVGIPFCFYVNAVSFLAAIAGLYMMRVDDLVENEPVEREKGQLREGFRYVWQTPVLRTTLVMMAVLGTMVYNFQTLLPLFAHFTFNGDAALFALFMSVMGAGAVVGGLVAANRKTPQMRAVVLAAFALGVFVLATAFAPGVTSASVLLFFVGVASTSFVAVGNATLQVNSDPSMRGRVMALFAVAFLGSTPIGGPLVGFVSQHLGPRVGLGMGAIAAFGAGIYGWVVMRRDGGEVCADPSDVLLAEAEGEDVADVKAGSF